MSIRKNPFPTKAIKRLFRWSNESKILENSLKIIDAFLVSEFIIPCFSFRTPEEKFSFSISFSST